MVDETCETYGSPSWSCQECGGNLVINRGHVVCAECGLVNSREYVHPTYQMGENYDSDGHDATSYVSLGNRMHIVDGLGSYIGFHRDAYFRDAHGQAMSGKDQRKFKRLKSVYSTRVRIGRDEAKYRALRTLNHVSKLLMLTEQVRDRTAYLYKKIAESGERVSNNILLMAVCLLTAVREFREGAPITLEEIADVFEKCGHRVNVRAIVRESSRLRSLTGYCPSVRKPEDYIPRVISMLMNDSKVLSKLRVRSWNPKDYEILLRERIAQVLSLIPPSKRGGRNPFIFTVSAAYAADRMIAKETGRKAALTQKLVSRATQVAEYSIRDHFGMMKDAVEAAATLAVPNQA
ncbi:MAG: transcription initiation factor IIB family protein [Candidatus Thorarchaeota archaeon]|nr:transcription initiation factor IIB family protein [Candidatus Thorarchaeota archaeon]